LHGLLRGRIYFNATGMFSTPGDRLRVGSKAPAFVDAVMSKDCPVSASLTDEDKSLHLKIRQEAVQKIPPSAASKGK
jgi:hypothetical protein